ncbi:MAG TPA: hypothetical protein DCZ40_05430 [Lachnospiraceae bacterium]|nr:hypothetical protein [Lachnospiraceae bacterium]
MFDSEKLIKLLAYDEFNPLLFNTGLFLILFVVFVGIVTILRKHKILKLISIILFSLYFYYKSSAEYCFILLGVCVSDYVLGLLMMKSKHIWQKKIIVTLNVVMNVGMLFYFKYFNLLYETIANFAGKPLDPLDIVLPAGISFFTFRSISYIVDIYRGEIEACRDFLAYTFYLTFFPPLLAGPVVRAKDMLPQVEANPEVTAPMVSEGLFLIMCGLIKKVIVADYLSQNFVDRVFDNPALYSGFENLMGAYGFTIQLYCDFSGYSDMAIGLALLMGYSFFDNFKAPFKAQNPTEFWHRWHISLSTWLKDYVYIPLGGNRVSGLRHCLNLMLTFLISGLWHGAGINYILWGGIHGTYQIAETMFKKYFRFSAGLHSSKKGLLSLMATFGAVCFAWVFFRANTLSDAWRIISLSFYGIGNLEEYVKTAVICLDLSYAYMIYLCIPILLLAIYDYASLKTDVIAYISSQKPWVRYPVYVLFLLVILLFSEKGVSTEFYYFQF